MQSYHFLFWLAIAMELSGNASVAAGHNVLFMNAIDPCSHVMVMFPLAKELGTVKAVL